MTATVVAVFMMFASVMMVIAASAVVVEEASGRSGDAGFVIAFFSAATVLTDLGMPRLLRTRSASWLLAIGIAIITVSAPLFVAASHSAPAMMVVSALRGVGFAFGSVTASLFVINLAPPEQRGRALGLYGVAATVPGIVAPSIGLLLLEAVGVGAAFGTAAGIGLLGFLAAVRGRDPRAVGAHDAALHEGRMLRRALALAAVRRPFIVSLVAMVGLGGVLAFVPLALPSSGAGSAPVFLLTAGVCRAVARWASGGLIDRHGATAPLLAGTAVTIGGFLFLIGERSALPAIIAAAAVGVVLNAGYVAMIHGAEKGTLGVISTLWNLSIDGGVGVGALALGVVAASSLDAVFVVLPLLVALALPVAWRAHSSTAAGGSG